MPNLTEKEPKPAIPEGVKERQEEMVVPEKIQDIAKPTHSQVTAQVQDDSGKHLIQTPKTKTVTIQLPSDQKQLTDWSKGSISESLTWWGVYWLRMLKKAVAFGWRIITRSNTP